MGNILNGLVLLILGLLLWLVGSFIGAFLEFTGQPTGYMMAIVALGFLVMIGGPVVFWIILPIRNWIRRRREPELEYVGPGSGEV